MSQRLFEDANQAFHYSRARPSPPANLITQSINYLNEKILPNSNSKWQLAIDVGAGTGQCTRLLQPYFEKIIGFDVSEAQVNEANKGNSFLNVHYAISEAESLPLPDDSVDLLTACQCLHWFDMQAFFKEAQRVLKTDGVLAVIGHDVPKLYSTDKQELPLTNLLYDTFHGDILKPYIQSDRLELLHNGYKDIEFPFAQVSRENVHTDLKTTAEDCIELIKSWSNFQSCVQNDHSTAMALINDLQQAFISHFNQESLSKIEMIARRNYALILCRK
ncbi:putative methyltransferase-like protein [Dinothrombium tinctorium]|uniref:Putative methyltransferase-like protein n=1 Tax=Dinothrombium tinctorium TaxID=1965070 RepID=A0A3S3PD12_9ACAR|nr:putative methyltransferase-like protein [Dinothrombium tinctorium]